MKKLLIICLIVINVNAYGQQRNEEQVLNLTYDENIGAIQAINVSRGALAPQSPTVQRSSDSIYNLSYDESNGAVQIVLDDSSSDIPFTNLSGLTNGQFLAWDSIEEAWVNVNEPSGVSVHSDLTGLIAPADDHTQYGLLLGRAGGQTLIGGTGSGNELTLQSTSNATKGNIIFGTSVYDEVNNYLGINQIPSSTLTIKHNGETGLKVYDEQDYLLLNQTRSSHGIIMSFRQNNTVEVLIDTTNDAFNVLHAVAVGKSATTVGADRQLEVLHASNPQMRLTQTEDSVYSEFQTDSNGLLKITSTGDRISLNGLTVYSTVETVNDDAELTMTTGVSGWGFASIGDNTEFCAFRFAQDGTVTLLTDSSANCVNTDSDTDFCVYDCGSGICIKNRIGWPKRLK